MSLIGFHFVDNIYTDAQIEQHLTLIERTRPAWINVLGGAQYDQALAFAVDVRKRFPETRVIFRHRRDGADDGMHTRMSADAWWASIGRLYIGKDLTILTDNESGAADLTYYAAWHARAMELAGPHGVSLAVGRFSTGNPPEHQYAQLDPMWRALAKWRPLHIWSPNAYWDVGQYAGHLDRFLLGWQRCADLEAPTPPTVIGEFGRAVGFDPHKGYKAVNMPGGDYALASIDLVRRYFYPGGVAACVFCVGPWPIGGDTFGIDSAFIQTLEKHNQEFPDMPEIDDPRWLPYRASAKDKAGANVRSIPFTSGLKLFLIPQAGVDLSHIPFTQLTPDEQTYAQQTDGLWQVVKLADDRIGYVRSDVVKLEAVVIPPPPPPEETTEQKLARAIEALQTETLLKSDLAARLESAIPAWQAQIRANQDEATRLKNRALEIETLVRRLGGGR